MNNIIAELKEWWLGWHDSVINDEQPFAGTITDEIRRRIQEQARAALKATES